MALWFIGGDLCFGRHSVNEDGHTAVNLASNCKYNKISWAVLGMDMPPYVVDDCTLDKSSASMALDIFHRNNVAPQSYNSYLSGNNNDMSGELLDES